MNKSADSEPIWTGTLKAHAGQGNYLKVDDSGMLVATGTSERDPACSFSIYRSGSNETLRSNLNGHYAGAIVDEDGDCLIKVDESFDTHPLSFGLLFTVPGQPPPTVVPIIFINTDPRYYPGQTATWQYLGAFAQYKIGVIPTAPANEPTQIFNMDPPLQTSIQKGLEIVKQPV